MSKKTKILEVKDLKQYFTIRKGILGRHKSEVRAVDGVSFDVYEGETLGIVGESGCGKSTLVRSLIQLTRAQQGSILFKGHDLRTLSEKELLPLRYDMQMIFQDPYASLNPSMTVKKNISEPLVIYKKYGLLKMTQQEMHDRVIDLMRKVGLLESYLYRYPHEFSGGQRQRIGIARALALNPSLILADEPVSALDVSIQSQILNLLKDLQDELQLTYVFIAHDLAVVRYISHRIAVMYLGKIVEIADTERLYENPLHPYTKALLSSAPIPDPHKEKNRERIILSGEISFSNGQKKGCHFADRCPNAKEKCHISKPILEEIEEGHFAACFYIKN